MCNSQPIDFLVPREPVIYDGCWRTSQRTPRMRDLRLGDNPIVIKKTGIYGEPGDMRLPEIEDLFFLGKGTFTFEMLRGADESGVSGTGKVLEGVIFSDHTTVVRWVTTTAPHSTTIFDNADVTTGWHKFINVHVQPHAFNEVTIKFSNGWYWKQECSSYAVLLREHELHYGHNNDDKCNLCAERDFWKNKHLGAVPIVQSREHGL